MEGGKEVGVCLQTGAAPVWSRGPSLQAPPAAETAAARVQKGAEGGRSEGWKEVAVESPAHRWRSSLHG